jgi:hypothetical protein
MEQSGGAGFVGRLLGTTSIGVSNIEAAFAGSDTSFNQFGEFYLRWVATLALGSEGLSSDPRYSYAVRTRNAETQNWQGVILTGDADDGRGTELSGVALSSYSGYTASTLMPGGVQFYRVGSSSPDISLYGRGAGSFGAVVVRVK